MKSISPETRKIFLTIGAVLGWFAVIMQFYLIIINRSTSVVETIIRFFSFFTILTNILVAGCFTFLLLKPNSRPGVFFARPAALTAITVYITVVGLVYNLILRFLWSPQGLQFIVDELLHSVIPAFVIFYWLLFVSKTTLKWKNIFPWLIYPAVYCIYSLLRGILSGLYPYPFINVKLLGYSEVFVNIGGLVFVFFAVSALFVGISKLVK